MAISATTILGALPDCRDGIACLFAALRVRNYHLNLLPKVYSHTYYFSQSGDDATGDGSIGSPWRSMSKCNTEFAGLTGGENARCLFRRGDVWVEDQQITLPASCHIGNFGNANAEIPFFNRFTIDLSGTWTNTSGNIYRIAHGQSAISMVRLGRSRRNHLKKATVASSPGENEWGADATYVYINVGADPTGDAWEACGVETTSGILMTDNGYASVDGVRLDGYGAGTGIAAQGYPIKNAGDGVLVVWNCEGYYGERHGISLNGGGVMICINCDSGLCTGDINATVFNSFHGTGGQELHLFWCTTRFGAAIPKHDNATLKGTFAHSSPPNEIGIHFRVGCDFSPPHDETDVGPVTFGNLVDAPNEGTTFTDMTEYRVRCSFKSWESGSRLDTDPGIAWIASDIRIRPADTGSLGNPACNPSHYIGSRIVQDGRDIPATRAIRALANLSTGAGPLYMQNCHVHHIGGNDTTKFMWDHDANFALAGDAAYQGVFINTIFSAENTSNSVPGVGNTTNMVNCAFYAQGDGDNTAQARGYGNALNTVELDSFPNPNAVPALRHGDSLSNKLIGTGKPVGIPLLTLNGVESSGGNIGPYATSDEMIRRTPDRERRWEARELV